MLVFFSYIFSLAEPLSKPVPAKRKRPNDRKTSLPESTDLREVPFHYANQEHSLTAPALSELNGILGKDSSESPESEIPSSTFHDNSLRISDSFDAQVEDIISPCDSSDPSTVCGFQTIESSGLRGDDSALPSSGENSAGSDGILQESVQNSNCCSNVERSDFSDSGEVLQLNLESEHGGAHFENSDVLELTADTVSSKPTTPHSENNPLLNGMSLCLSPSDPSFPVIPPDVPPRTYKAPPLPPRHRHSEVHRHEEPPPLPPRIEKEKPRPHSGTTPTSPSHMFENIAFSDALVPPPLPPRTYSPIHMQSGDGASGSGGSLSLVSTEDSTSFDSLEAFAGSHESSLSDNSSGERIEREPRSRSSGLGVDVSRREHHKLQKVSKGVGLDSLSNVSSQNTLGKDRHLPEFHISNVENIRAMDSGSHRSDILDRNRSASVDTPIDMLQSVDLSSVGEDTPPPVQRLRSVDSSRSDTNASPPPPPVERHRNVERDTAVNRLETPPPVNRRHFDSAPPTVERHKNFDLNKSSDRHKHLHTTQSIGRHRNKESAMADRHRTFDLPPPFDRQRSVDSIPVDRLHNTDVSFDMPPSLPPLLDRQKSHESNQSDHRSEVSDNHIGDYSEHVNSGLDRQSSVENQLSVDSHNILERQHSNESHRTIERQISSESQLSGSNTGLGSFATGFTPKSSREVNLAPKQTVRRSISPAVRRIMDAPERSVEAGSDAVPALPQRGAVSDNTPPPRPVTPPRPVPERRDNTPSPPIIYPRSRALSEEEKHQNRQHIHQHLKNWTQKQKERANTSFGSDVSGDLELPSPMSETRSCDNWVLFDDNTTPSNSIEASPARRGVTEHMGGAEGGLLPGHSAISTPGRHSPSPANSVVWQLRHGDDQSSSTPDVGKWNFVCSHFGNRHSSRLLFYKKKKKKKNDILTS